jgi:hypothetical protein
LEQVVSLALHLTQMISDTNAGLYKGFPAFVFYKDEGIYFP